jgi:ABC-type transporter Mla MlaB component
MLRISQVNGHDLNPTLKVEGKLHGPWVAELARACAESPCSLEFLSLDLSAVSFVDGSGVELLRGLLSRGVTLAACSGLVAELLRVKGQ